MDVVHSPWAVIPISNICTMTIEYSPMPCHDCSLLSIFDSIPFPMSQVMPSFPKKKIKRQPHPILYGSMNMLISNVVGDHVDLPVKALQHHPGKRINIMNWHHNIS